MPSSTPPSSPPAVSSTAESRAVLRRLVGISPAIAISIAYLVVRPASKDFASGDFRARLFGDGAYIWNLHWFGGHPLPGYGIISPMLGAWFGVVPVSIGSMLVAAWCFAVILERCTSSSTTVYTPTLGAMLFSIGCGLSLWGGRLTFGPAVAFGCISVLCLQRKRRVAAVVAAGFCGLSSPVGALSLAIVATACWAARTFPRRDLALVGAAAVVPPTIVGLAFPEGGWYPFPSGSFLMLAIALAFIGWFGRRMATVRLLVIVYALVATAAFAVRSPLGGNIVRLAWLAAAPAATVTVTRFRRTLLPLFVAVTMTWGWSYVKLGFQPAAASASSAYYDPLAAFVLGQPGVQRVEVVPTESFGQADRLALEINIARGWETQLDRALNPEFYDHLTAATYHEWLLRNSVSLVALPTSGVQPSSDNERSVIRSAPDYLDLVWSTPDWRVFRVTDAAPLADNGTTIKAVGTQTLTIEASRTGTTTVRFRYSRWFRVTTGSACIESSPDGWLSLRVDSPGTIVLDASFSLANAVSVSRCS